MTPSLSTLEQLMFSLIEVWQASGQRQRVFCQEKNLAYSKFQYWRKRYKDYRSTPAVGEPRQDEPFGQAFVAVSVKQGANIGEARAGSMELIFPDGRRLIFNHGVEAGFLRTLLS